MSPFLAELVGTAILILLGNGVVANAVLAKSKGKDAGWIVITAGWAMAVMVAVYAVGRISGAHLNPAVSLALASLGKFEAAKLPAYLAGQFVGAFVGAGLVWATYYPHWAQTEDQGGKLACFCTAPAIRMPLANLVTEAIGTAVLVVGVLALGANETAPGLGPLLVGLLVFSIGLSLGGPTGYAINPARDLGPRLAHALLPIAGKGGSDWGYAWVPVVGPVLGGVAGAQLFRALWGG